MNHENEKSGNKSLHPRLIYSYIFLSLHSASGNLPFHKIISWSCNNELSLLMKLWNEYEFIVTTPILLVFLSIATTEISWKMYFLKPEKAIISKLKFNNGLVLKNLLKGYKRATVCFITTLQSPAVQTVLQHIRCGCKERWICSCRKVGIRCSNCNGTYGQLQHDLDAHEEAKEDPLILNL